VFVGTALGLFFVGVVVGIVLGVVASLALLISRASKSPLRCMAYDSKEQVYVEADIHPDATTQDGVLVVGMNGPCSSPMRGLSARTSWIAWRRTMQSRLCSISRPHPRSTSTERTC
jgi:hypothetical protein